VGIADRLKAEWESDMIPLLLLSAIASGAVESWLKAARRGIHRASGWIHVQTYVAPDPRPGDYRA
jgi:hypothetical protein